MLKKYRLSFNLLLFSGLIIVALSCNNKYYGDFVVIKACLTQNSARPCFLMNRDIRLTVESIRKYKDGILVEYQGCASEGAFTVRFGQNNNTYSNEDYLVKLLSIKRINDTVVYFDKQYKIERDNKDSIFIKLPQKNEFLILIGELPSVSRKYK